MTNKRLSILNFAVAAFLFLTWMVPGGEPWINALLLVVAAYNVWAGLRGWEGK